MKETKDTTTESLMNNKLTLLRRGFDSFQGWKFWLQMVILFAIFGVVSFFYYDSLKTHHSLIWVYFLVPILSAIYLLFYSRYMKESKIEVDEFGLVYHSGLPSLFQRFDPDWRISWGEIQSITPVHSLLINNPIIFPLKINLLNKSIEIYPTAWIDPQDSSYKPRILEVKSDFVSLYENTPLVKEFIRKGLLDAPSSAKKPIQTKWADRAGWTDINSSPLGLGMAGIFFLSMFYFIFEVMAFLSEFYIDTPPYKYNAIAAVIAMLAGYLILMFSKFKNIEKLVFALLMGVSAAAVTYPLLLRINQWTDTEGLQSYSYSKISNRTWEPAESNSQLPKLKFDYKSYEFWSQYEAGTIKEFELRKGGLGFYQLNMKPVYEEQRSYYQGR